MGWDSHGVPTRTCSLDRNRPSRKGPRGADDDTDTSTPDSAPKKLGDKLREPRPRDTRQRKPHHRDTGTITRQRAKRCAGEARRRRRTGPDRGNYAAPQRAADSRMGGARPSLDAVSSCPGAPLAAFTVTLADISSSVLFIVSGTVVCDTPRRGRETQGESTREARTASRRARHVNRLYLGMARGAARGTPRNHGSPQRFAREKDASSRAGGS